MTEQQMEWHERLRAPFPRETIGKLPKGGVQLDYVGHAAVTDRLLSVDPEWNWEPMGFTPEGLPALDRDGNLWIRLTIHGHTRLGVGDGRSMKEKIGDALRNGAMRFGVALDLWSKDELESGGKFEAQAPSHVSNPPRQASADQFAPPQFSDDDQRAWLDSVGAQNTVDELQRLWHDAQKRGAITGVQGFQAAVTARKAELLAKHGEAA